MPRKTYIRAPNDDYAPDNNIRLGCVWRDPLDPGSFIGAPLPIPDNIKVNHNFKSSWTINLGQETHGKIGLWAKIAQLPAGANGGVHWDSAEDGAYTIPLMDTESFEPTPEYVKDSISSIATDIIRSGGSLFMITGVKIARGGEGSNKESKSRGTDARVGLHSSEAGTVIDAAAQLTYSNSLHNTGGFSATGDFVFAYRVREVLYKKGVVKTKQYNKGAVLWDMQPAIDSHETDGQMLAVKQATLDHDDFRVEGQHYSFTDEDGVEADIVL